MMREIVILLRSGDKNWGGDVEEGFGDFFSLKEWA
jgi:hypothetical protein